MSFPRKRESDGVESLRMPAGVYPRAALRADPGAGMTLWVSASAHLRAVAQRVVGQYARHHGFADRDSADADARVMPALGRDLGVVAGDVDGFARREDGRGRLDRKTRDDRLAGRDAAQNAARVIGEE